MWKKFDARKKLRITKKTIKGSNKKAIIFFPYWTGKSSIYEKLSKQFPEHTLVFYNYPNEVMSEDVKVSLNYINQLLKDSSKLIRNLRKKGIKEITLFGSSFGSNIALKLSTMIIVDKLILNMMDRDIAKVIFTSPALVILRTKLIKKGFNLDKLDKIYEFLSLDYNIKKIKNKKMKILIFLSKTDIFCRVDDFKSIFKKMDKMKLNYQLKINRFLGHIPGIYKNIKNHKVIDFIED
ncbi:hypothetical protein GF386_05025 [Candidatus Pacearchaeota archaeon]|nr:hypothetical protein [Candidatus Pacearchaeota archaeon]MBD3283473.1 hypothetical protein [Candidatus Pacearchaeota archaeon]